MKNYTFVINNNSYTVLIKEVNDDSLVAEVNGVDHTIGVESIENISPLLQSKVQQVISAAPSSTPVFTPPPAITNQTKSHGTQDEILSPIPGQILGISVSKNDKVRTGQKLLTLEAMKLENAITAGRDGVVKDILVSEGDVVNQGQLLVILE